MSTGTSAAPPPPNRQPEAEFGHPRGTLAIVVIFGSLFLLGWLVMYFYVFLERGATHP